MVKSEAVTSDKRLTLVPKDKHTAPKVAQSGGKGGGEKYRTQRFQREGDPMGFCNHVTGTTIPCDWGERL